MNGMFDLSGKVALVTGASQGLGKAMALALAGAGADVGVMSRNVSRLEETAGEIRGTGQRAVVARADVTIAAEVTSAVERVLGDLGRIDILVNDSGIGFDRPLVDMTEEEWDRILDTNLKGAMLVTKAVGPHMIARRSGKVINVASMAGTVAVSGFTAYGASKAGLIQLTRVLGLEWARYNIQVNAICPGYFLTPMNDAFFATEAGQRVIKQAIPARRLGRPEELGGAVIYLASEASDFMTGTTICIDGGQSLP